MNTPQYNANVCQLIADVAKGNKRPALIMPDDRSGGSISFAELWKSACIVSASLQNAGLSKGERAIIMIPMSIDLYISLLAVVKLGAVAVFVDPWIPAKKMAAVSSFADPTAFIGIGKSHWLRLMERRLRKIELTVTTGPCFAGFPAKHQLARLKSGSPNWFFEPVDPDDSALITFTSGSSGEPKGANRTHRFLAAQHRALSQEFPYEPTDIDMPMFPIFALNNLVSGVTSVVPEMDFRKVADVDGSAIANQITTNRVTTCTASPPFIDRLCDEVESRGRKMPMRRVLTGGAPVSNRQLRRWQNILNDTEFIVAYGSTEAEPVSHISAHERLNLDSAQPGYCTGKPTDLVQSRVIRICKTADEMRGQTLDEMTLLQGEVGELVVTGEHVCRDYYKNPKATTENKLRDNDGNVWHRMGDTGSFDAQGRFWLAGRVHSTIVRDGNNVHPQFVEQLVSDEFVEILQVAAVGMDDDQLGQACWVVFYSENAPVSVAKEIQSLFEQTGTPCDKVIELSEPLPVDPRHNSKIDYSALKQHLLALQS